LDTTDHTVYVQTAFTSLPAIVVCPCYNLICGSKSMVAPFLDSDVAGANDGGGQANWANLWFNCWTLGLDVLLVLKMLMDPTC